MTQHSAAGHVNVEASAFSTKCRHPVIALLTDFGHADPYVAQMKGAVLQRASGVQIIDISHEISPFGIAQAGFFLRASQEHFPCGSVFVAVVDPGVGTSRRILCLVRKERLFLAPDNGLLSMLLDAPGPANLYDVTPPRGALDAVSRTFHGRDVFAPLAAQLATGVAPAAIGTFLPLEQAVRLPDAGPVWRPDGALAVRVLHVDRFGNCILNVPTEPWRDALAAWGSLAMRLADGTVFPAVLAETYVVLPSRDVLGVLAGSQGYLELALDRDSAARRLGLHPGDALHLVSGETL